MGPICVIALFTKLRRAARCHLSAVVNTPRDVASVTPDASYLTGRNGTTAHADAHLSGGLGAFTLSRSRELE